jgi:hypothetical protein
LKTWQQHKGYISYGKREISSDFRLRTSHFEVQTSDFGIVISGFSPSLVLAYSHQTKIAAPMKADDSVSIQINSWFILIFLFNPQDIKIKWGICVIAYLTISRYIYLGSKKSQYRTFFISYLVLTGFVLK